MEEMKIIIEKFEIFLKRSVLPSTSFMLFFLLYDILFNQKSFINFLNNPEHSQFTIGLFILAFIGLTNLLSILHQAIYDNHLKNNFNATFIWKNENTKLDALRKEVNMKLNKNENDYMLYKNIAKNMETRDYVNQAKSFGIMFVSLMTVSAIGFISFLVETSVVLSFVNILISFVLLILITTQYYIGRELVKSRYRSRAIKIYTNYLKENTI